MARIRSIHPGLFTDEGYVCLSMTARVLFFGLLTECDDRGVFEWKPTRLKIRLLPADDASVGLLLEEMVHHSMVMKYTIQGKDYGAVKNFCKWQRPKTPQFLHPYDDVVLAYVGVVIPREQGERGVALGKILSQRQNSRCFYCSEPITHFRKRAESLEVDHKIPMSRGGEDDISNLAAACKPCNSLKGALTDTEFSARFSTESLAANCRDKRRSQSATSESQNPFPPNGEATLLMEEGGGKREEGGDSKTISADAESENPDPSFAESLSRDSPQPQNSRLAPKEKIPAKPKRAAAKRPLPDDWGLDPRGPEVAYALAKGMKIDEVRVEAEAFRNYHRAKGNEMADWNAAWRTWAGNWQKFNGKGASNGRKNYPNQPTYEEQRDAAVREGLKTALAPLARRAGYATDGEDACGHVRDTERLWPENGVIEGNYSVISG